MKAQKGFTLVEILIVVVILGILAAIVIPQFTDASTEAKNSALRSNLQTVRAQIELYKIQHDYTPPGPVTSFSSLMTTSDGTYGPYLQAVPNNPWTGTNAVASSGTGDWNYNATSGAFTAADANSHATW